VARKSKKKTTQAAASKKKSTKKKTSKKKVSSASKKKSSRKKTAKKKVAKKSPARKTSTKKKSTKTKSAKKKKTTRKKTKKAGSSQKKKKTTKAVRGVKKPATEDFEAEKVIVKKSPMKKDELKHYRDMLLLRRAEVLGDITSMSAEALRADASNLSNMPLHMADVGSDYYEQELTLGLVESERNMIQEINEALARIAEGTYGVCQVTGKRIKKARLNAKPWAKYCIEAAREMERKNHNSYR